MKLELLVAPTSTPISVDSMKEVLRVTHDLEDTYIESCIFSAVEWVETYIGQQLLQATYAQYFDSFHCDLEYGDHLTLERAPLLTVDSITYTDSAGNEQTLSDYQIDYHSRPPRIYPPPGQVFPVTQAGAVNPVVVEYTAGFGGDEYAGIPHPILSAIRLLTADLFENRQPTNTGDISNQRIKALLRPYATELRGT